MLQLEWSSPYYHVLSWTKFKLMFAWKLVTFRLPWVSDLNGTFRQKKMICFKSIRHNFSNISSIYIFNILLRFSTWIWAAKPASWKTKGKIFRKSKIRNRTLEAFPKTTSYSSFPSKQKRAENCGIRRRHSSNTEVYLMLLKCK